MIEEHYRVGDRYFRNMTDAIIYYDNCYRGNELIEAFYVQGDDKPKPKTTKHFEDDLFII